MVFTPIPKGGEWRVSVEKKSSQQAILPLESSATHRDMIKRVKSKSPSLIFETFVDGQEYSYKEINTQIGYKSTSTMLRGIIPIPKGKHTAIMLRVNLRKNLYDEWYDPESPVLHYIGEGLRRHGDQEMKRGNKILANSQGKDLHLFVHTREQKQGF